MDRGCRPSKDQDSTRWHFAVFAHLHAQAMEMGMHATQSLETTPLLSLSASHTEERLSPLVFAYPKTRQST